MKVNSTFSNSYNWVSIRLNLLLDHLDFFLNISNCIPDITRMDPKTRFYPKVWKRCPAFIWNSQAISIILTICSNIYESMSSYSSKCFQMLFSIREKVFLIQVGMSIKNTHYQYCKKNKKSDFFSWLCNILLYSIKEKKQPNFTYLGCPYYKLPLFTAIRFTSYKEIRKKNLQK